MMVLDDYFKEWEDLISLLPDRIEELNALKEIYLTQSVDIELNTDFKELYGKNNAEIRKYHIHNELKQLVDDINELEKTIIWLRYRVSFLKEVVKTQRILNGV